MGLSPPTTLVPPPNGIDGDAVLGAVAQDRGDGVVVAGQQHGVGRVLYPGVLAPQQVEGGLAAGVQQPIAVGGAAVLGADDFGQRVLIRCDNADGRS